MMVSNPWQFRRILSDCTDNELLKCISVCLQGSPALHADILGGSGPGEDGEGYAKVDCNTSAENGGAKCDGTASHDA